MAGNNVAPRPYRLAILGGMASYIDAGCIIAVATMLALWQAALGLSPLTVGLLSAVLTVCIGLGALIGGRLGDRIGRKRIFAADLLIFAVGALLLMVPTNVAVLFLGLVIVGLAIGADVPTSLALIGEMAPADKRGKLLVVTQMMWIAGPIVTGILGASFGALLGTNLGILLFGQLVVAALVTWFLRRRMFESPAWVAASAKERTANTAVTRGSLRGLLDPRILRGVLFTGVFYVAITVASNFVGSFGTYTLVTIGGLPTEQALLASTILLPVPIIGIILIFRTIDTGARRPIFVIGAVIAAASWLVPVVFGPSVLTILVALAGFSFGAILAGEPHYKVWSQELFPTTLRGTAQGLTFGVGRLASAGFTVFVPVLLAADFTTLMLVMVGICAFSGLVGGIFMPRRQNQTLAEIDAGTATGSFSTVEASARV